MNSLIRTSNIFSMFPSRSRSFVHFRHVALVFLLASCSAEKIESAPKPLSASPSDLLSEMTGWYTSGEFCENTQEMTHCVPAGGWVDIKKLDATHASFYIDNDDPTGLHCRAAGIAELKGAELTFMEVDKHSSDYGNGLAIYKDGPLLRFRRLQWPDATNATAFCSTGESVDRMTFKVIDKKPEIECRCPIE